MTSAYVIRRLLQTAFILVIVVTLNFFLPRLVPGDPAERFYNDPRLTLEQKQQIRQDMGLDKSLPQQYVAYIANALRGDLGISYGYRRPVMSVIANRIPWTIALTGASLVLSVLIGAVLGAYAGIKRGGLAEKVVLGGAIAFSALPSFWLGLLLLLFLAFYVPVFPAYGMIDVGVVPGLNWAFVVSITRHAFLPVVTMTVMGAIGYALLVRSTMVEVVGSEYIQVARAKGLSERAVLLRHALRNALLPLVTNVGMRLSGLIGGAVVIETIFSWQGMGLLVFEASSTLDYPLMQGAFLILSTLTIFGNFLADLTYALIDPRVKLR